MATMTEVTIPYKPRYPEVHKTLERARFCVIVAHRRFGKTVLALNHMLKMALMCDKQRGRFAYVAPFRNQAEQVTWDYLKYYTSVIPGRKINEAKLEISLPSNGGGSKIRVYGADNPDSLRGPYLDGVILDEVAQMKREVWEEVLQPMLADRLGWALFIGTPKGVNLFSEQYNAALKRQSEGNRDWAAFCFPVTSTNVLDANEVNRLQEEMSANAFRQEMLCDFSASSDDILIPLQAVIEAQNRVYRKEDYDFSPVVLGVDVARFGDDASVIFPRQGLVAYPPVVLRKTDNMALADRIAHEKQAFKASAIFIDAGGGAGVIDRLRQLGHSVLEVNFGGAAANSQRFLNRRMEIWQRMADWLQGGGALPPDDALKAELTTPTYSFNERGLMRLESKERIKERLLRSPDRADALALTFAMTVAAPDIRQEKVEYDPLAW